MRVGVIGTGYVGLVTGACFAETGNHVVCVDALAEKVRLLRDGEIPFYEPGLKELVARNAQENRLLFTQSLQEALAKAEIAFICVGTPSAADGSADLSQVFQAAKEIAQVAPKGMIVTTKSTVPVGTGDQVEKILREAGRDDLIVVSNPEFLREGSAVQDCLLPDRVVVGTDNQQAANLFKTLYQPFLRTGKPFLIMQRRSAEVAKYASNALLATRIAFMNEISRLCEALHANVQDVRQAVGTDHRIGMEYIFPSIGYGGSCFPKDVKALYSLSKEVGIDTQILGATIQSNEEQKNNFVRRIAKHFGGDAGLKGKQIAIWGTAFKAKTDDVRESPAMHIIDALLNLGATVCIFDPAAMQTSKLYYGDKVKYAKSAYQALDGAHALCVLTEWNQFRHPDFQEIGSRLKAKTIFDGRNLYSHMARDLPEFKIYSVGIANT